MTLRIGVLPTESRNTPTPTSIFPGRRSAPLRAMSASSESLATGGRSARLFALACVCVSMEARLAKSGVVIHCDAIAERHRLAGQHVALRNFLVGETVMDGHLDLPLGHLRAAGRANTGLASERCGKAGSPRAVEDVAGGERHPTRTAIEGHCYAHSLGLGLQLRDFLCDGFRWSIGGEPLDVDTLLGNVAV